MPRTTANHYPTWEEIARASQIAHIASITSEAELHHSLGSAASRYRFIERMRWPDGFRCRCGEHAKHDQAVLRPEPGLLTCRNCKAITRVVSGTMLDDRRAPLSRWLSLFWTFAQEPTAVDVETVREVLELESSKLAERRWRALDALLMLGEYEPLNGEVEVDGRVLDLGSVHAIVLVAVEDREGGRLRLRHAGHLGADVVHQFVQEVVQPGSVVRTDCWSGYLALSLYQHELHGMPETIERLGCVDATMTKLRRWLRSRREVGFEQLSHYLRAYVAEQNWRAQHASEPERSVGRRFCDLLGLALRSSGKLRGKRLRARISGVRRVDGEEVATDDVESASA
jgi:hypothetical protein